MSDLIAPTPNPTTDQARPPPAWYAAYPAPRSAIAPSIPREEVLQLFRDGKVSNAEVILVDLRRDDFKVRVCLRIPQVVARTLLFEVDIGAKSGKFSQGGRALIK